MSQTIQTHSRHSPPSALQLRSFCPLWATEARCPPWLQTGAESQGAPGNVILMRTETVGTLETYSNLLIILEQEKSQSSLSTISYVV